jgi:hypothetical protein
MSASRRPPDVAFPPRHRRDVGLHGGVALAPRDLRVAAREEGRFCDLAGLRLRRLLARFAAFASARLVAAFFATFADFLDVLLAIAFTRRCLRYATVRRRAASADIHCHQSTRVPRLGGDTSADSCRARRKARRESANLAQLGVARRILSC